MNRTYKGRKLDNIGFPMGGLGAGMVCLDGTGSFDQVSVRNEPDIYQEPNMFAAVAFKGGESHARVLEGQVPQNKYYGSRLHGVYSAGMGMGYKNYGLPRFRECEFTSHFPFGEITLRDKTMPVDAYVTGYSPFIPGDADSSSLPAATVEYRLVNKTDSELEGVFYFSALQFMGLPGGDEHLRTRAMKHGFILEQQAFGNKPYTYGAFSILTDNENAVTDTGLYRGGWWDNFMMLWNTIEKAEINDRKAEDECSPGGSIAVPFRIAPNGVFKTSVNMNWYCPDTALRRGWEAEGSTDKTTYKPWYSAKYSSIEEVAEDYLARYRDLRAQTEVFTKAFYDTDLPDEITEAIAANLSILKSPTILRQTDGRLWGWEGCADTFGSCEGSCQHVWNYAQAICHLFPELERGLREVDFNEDMDERGHQQFRCPLPIRTNGHNFHAASDGEPGSIMKMYREWRISGDTKWLGSYWDKIILAIEYCIKTWDPDEKGVFREPHHNTYDIEFWGADPMCSSFYLGALKAVIEMGRELGHDISRYEKLYNDGRKYIEEKLWNGEYFYQDTEWKTLHAEFNDENDAVMKEEGPKYQYGKGLITDGVFGALLAKQCGLGDILDKEKTIGHLKAVYKYNFKRDFLDHANTERPGYALGTDSGVVICSWPRGGKPSLPVVYADEVFTGIEYQVATHMASLGMKTEALEIVKAIRARYDGEKRNPYDEYECGHWYARALASYGLIEAFSGVRYDAVTKTLYADKGDKKIFLATDTGFGTVTVTGDKIELSVKYGTIDAQHTEFNKE